MTLDLQNATASGSGTGTDSMSSAGQGGAVQLKATTARVKEYTIFVTTDTNKIEKNRIWHDQGFVRHHHQSRKLVLFANDDEEPTAETLYPKEEAENPSKRLPDDFELENGERLEFQGWMVEIGPVVLVSEMTIPLGDAVTSSAASNGSVVRTVKVATKCSHPPDVYRPKPFARHAKCSKLLQQHIDVLEALQSTAGYKELSPTFIYFPTDDSGISDGTIVPLVFPVQFQRFGSFLWRQAVEFHNLRSLKLLLPHLGTAVQKAGGTVKKMVGQLELEFDISMSKEVWLQEQENLNDKILANEKITEACGGPANREHLDGLIATYTYNKNMEVVYRTGDEESKSSESKSAKKRKKNQKKKKPKTPKPVLPSGRLLSHLEYLTFLHGNAYDGRQTPSYIYFPIAASYELSPVYCPDPSPLWVSPFSKNKKKPRRPLDISPIFIHLPEAAANLFATLFLTATQTTNILSIALLYDLLNPYVTEKGGKELRLLEQLSEEFKVDLEVLLAGENVAGAGEDEVKLDYGDELSEEKLLEAVGGEEGLQLLLAWQEAGEAKTNSNGDSTETHLIESSLSIDASGEAQKEEEEIPENT